MRPSKEESAYPDGLLQPVWSRKLGSCVTAATIFCEGFRLQDATFFKNSAAVLGMAVFWYLSLLYEYAIFADLFSGLQDDRLTPG